MMAGNAVLITVISRVIRKVPKKSKPITIKKGSCEGVTNVLNCLFVKDNKVVNIISLKSV